MAYWLIKSEPIKWSWDQQVLAGEKGTHWDGVRNHLAKQQMQAMKKGDLAFFYHSNEGKEIVGIVTIIKEFYPDPADPPFGMVDVAAVAPLVRPVRLQEIRQTPELAQMKLVTHSRLSVQPVSLDEWQTILKMSDSSS